MTPMKRKQYAGTDLASAVERVVRGGERAAVVGLELHIPYRTLTKHVARRRRGEVTVAKRRGPRPALPDEGERRVLHWMRELQANGLPVRRREVLVKANEVLKSLNGPEAEVSSGWYRRFRDRHPEVSGPGSHLVIAEDSEATEVGQGLEQEEQVHSEIQEEQEQDQLRSASEKAVMAIQKSYASTWPAQDVVDAFDVMLDPAKARMFSVMAPGELRDLWLRKQLRLMRSTTT